jgi:hypothetical protein
MLSFVVLLLLFLVGYIMQNSVRLLVTGKRAQGIVVGMDSSSRFTSEPGKPTLVSPLVEFSTPEGEAIRVSGRLYSSTPSLQLGDQVKIAYSRSNPKNAQFLLWKEFPLVPAGFVLGFSILIIFLWIAGILVTRDSTLDDPLHLLPAIISHLRLNPFRFPVLFILSLAIPSCVVGTYWTYQIASDLRDNGIKAIGHVTGTERSYSKDNDGTTGSGLFPMIAFEDKTGMSHTIRRSLAKPLSRLVAGDEVEVIYLANNPDQGRVNTWDEFWPSPLFFGFMGIAFFVMLCLVLNGYLKD